METHYSLTQDSESDPRPDEVDEQQSMEAVRDLLFGKKTREIGEQISALERRLTGSMEDLERRIEALEQFVKAEVNSAKEHFEQEQGRLEKRSAETGEKFRNLSEALDQRFSQLETHIGRIESETRTRILNHSKEIAGEIEESSRRVRESLDSEVEMLKQNATRRNELGEALIELGMRMAGDGEEIPETEEAGVNPSEAETGIDDGLPA